MMSNPNEILVKDKNGAWRVWKDGQWLVTAPPAAEQNLPTTTTVTAPTPTTPVLKPVDTAITSELSKSNPAPSSDVPPKINQASSQLVSKLLDIPSSKPVASSVPATPSIVKPPPLASTVSVLPAPATATNTQVDNLERYVAGIINGLKLTNLAPELQPRLANTIRLRLKDVRDTVDTRETLRRSATEGGVGLSEDASDLVVQAVLEAMPKLHEANAMAASSPVKFSTPSPTPTPVVPPVVEPAPNLDVAPTPAGPKIEAEIKSPAVVNPPILTDEKSASPFAPIIQPSMVDVRTRPPVVGPIDELRLFNIIDFRRLDPDPQRAAKRLREKIKLLEDESYDKMVEGVRAWRISPLYNLYLAIGHESLTAGKPINDILKSRQAQGQESLSDKEFETIMDLNKDLRF
jgi:hypothetical protein